MSGHAEEPSPDIRGSSRDAAKDDDWSVPNPQDITAELQKEFGDTQQYEAQGKLDEVVQKFHDSSMERWKSELDTLLVYAGLFSAVLTAFNVESYRLLQPDAVESTAAAISQLSEQLNHMAISSLTSDAIHRRRLLRDEVPPFSPPLFVIWVNCLWFSSLVISLASASIALIVKQWLYENNAGIAGTSRASTQLLQYRMDSLKRWRVRAIIMLVPVMLQLALIIFLVGLAILLWNLNRIVALVSSSFIGTLFLFLTAVTVLPAYRWDCCYRSPQALIVYTVVRAFRNRLTDALQRGNKFCAARRSAAKLKSIDFWWYTLLQRCCGILSRTTKYRTWQAQERINLSQQSGALNVETAVTAYSTTLDPACLDQMRIVLSGEPGLPLLRCLNALDIATGDGTVVPASFLKRNARVVVSRMLLYALRQMLAMDQIDHAKLARGWGGTVQALFNSYNIVLSGTSTPYDEMALRTAFIVSMKAKDTANRYTALRYLAAAVDVDSATSCAYSTVSHVLSAAEQWIEKQDASARSTTPPQINMTAFYIVVHCMLRVVEEKTDVPRPQRPHFTELCERARTALSALPAFLPDPGTLVRDPALCDQFSFGLQLLLAPLTRLSRAMEAPHAADTAPHLVDTPSPIHEDVVGALEGMWDTAWSVLVPGPHPARAEGLLITPRLAALQRDVESLFNPFGMSFFLASN